MEIAFFRIAGCFLFYQNILLSWCYQYFLRFLRRNAIVPPHEAGSWMFRDHPARGGIGESTGLLRSSVRAARFSYR